MWALKLALALSLVLALLAQPGAEKSPCDAKQVWEAMIRAKGGRERLETVRTFYADASVTQWVLLKRKRAEESVFYRFPDFSWSWWDPGEPGMFPITVTTLDLEKLAGRQIEGPSLKMAVKDYRPTGSAGLYSDTMLFLFETKWVRPALDGCALQPDGGTLVTAHMEKVRYRYHLPLGSGLPDSVEEEEFGSTIQHRFMGYENVGGLMLPRHQWRRRGVLNPVSWTLHFEVNPDYDPAILTSEPSLAAGREAWRPKKR